MVSVLAAALAGAGAALAGTPAQAAPNGELKLPAIDDTYSSSGRRSLNTGAADKLVVGRLNGDSKIAYLKFAVPAGARVSGARLRLVAVGRVAGTISLARVATNTWTERTLTSGTAPAAGAVVAAVTPKATDTEVTFALDKVVTGPGVHSFALRSSATAAVTRFRSTESRLGAPELTLTVGAAPVPADPAPADPAHTDPAPPVAAKPQPRPAGGECTTGALLVPSCGVLWGAAAGGFSDTPRDEALKDWEKASGRTASIFHQYHKGDEIFPTRAEIAMTRDPARPRVLLLNWKVAYGSTWAKVAAGQQDARIDRFAARIKSTYPEKFFLALNHEPENDVNTNPAAGMRAKDFAAMYRHVILRLRAKGVHNAINVMAYMGNERWMSQSWWKDLYPGDDVVDWIGLDSYVSAEKGAYHHGLFADLLDRRGTTGPGFYDWAVTRHPSKPLMVAEWGVYHRVSARADKSPGYRSVLPELAKRPAIKAIVYFDCLRDDQGDRNISISTTKAGLSAFRTLAADPIFDVKLT